MKNYYLRFENLYVRIDDVTKEVINVLNFPTQKSITKLDNNDYYDTIINQTTSWTTIDESIFNTKYNEVLTYLNNL